MRIPRRWAAPLLALSLPACMTLSTQMDPSYEGPRVYSGTSANAKQLGEGFLNLNLAFMVISLVDFPLSLVADTLILPVTVPQESARGERLAKHERSFGELKPSLVSVRPGEDALVVAQRLFERCTDLLEKQNDELVHCYDLEARVLPADGAVQSGAEYRRALRTLLEQQRTSGIILSYRSATYAGDASGVRVEAARARSDSGAQTPVSFRLAPGSDGGWRIVEASGVALPAAK